MKWSWKLARVAGIDLRIHATFLILLAWLALVSYRQGGAAGAAASVSFVLALFASVVVHELGHSLAARHVGVRTRDITLLPIGGVARLERIPDAPRQELWIALAGPAVTVVVAAALYAVLASRGAPVAPADDLSLAGGSLDAFLAQLMWMNLWLLGFNLLPAFPMDGGRVLRALLALRMDHRRATSVAARLGQLFALAFGIIGLLYSPMLVLIALFVWLGAASESASAQLRSTVAGMRVEQAMIADVRTLSPGDTLDVALQHVLSGFQEDFPVLDGERLAGMLTRGALLRGLAKEGRTMLVADAMEPGAIAADAAEPLDEAIPRLLASRTRSIPVLAGGRLQGLLTTDNVAELVMIDAALRKSAHGEVPGIAAALPAAGGHRAPVAPIVRIGGTLVLVALLGACSVSRRQEEKMGREHAAELETRLAIVRDAQLDRYFTALGEELARAAGDGEREWRFYLVNTREVNAFALPGGHVYVTRGLAERTASMSQLAGVVAHEISHVTRRHAVKQLEATQQANVAVTLVCVLTGACGGIVTQAGIEIGGAAVLAKYSRDQESRADADAVRTLVRAGIHPGGIPELLEALIAERKAQPSGVAAWFSTHPTEEARLAQAGRDIASLGPAAIASLRRDSAAYRAFRARLRALRAPPAPAARRRAPPGARPFGARLGALRAPRAPAAR